MLGVNKKPDVVFKTSVLELDGEGCDQRAVTSIDRRVASEAPPSNLMRSGGHSPRCGAWVTGVEKSAKSTESEFGVMRATRRMGSSPFPYGSPRRLSSVSI